MKVIFGVDDSKGDAGAEFELQKNTVVEIGRGTLKTAVELSAEDAAGLLSLIESGKWMEPADMPACDNDCAINLGGRLSPVLSQQIRTTTSQWSNLIFRVLGML